MSAKLTRAERDLALPALLKSGWSHDDARDSITKTFTFKGFPQAFAFMTRLALAAEKADHHPEWTNVYNKVTITLTTHSAKGLTEKDVAFARLADQTEA